MVPSEGNIFPMKGCCLAQKEGVGATGSAIAVALVQCNPAALAGVPADQWPVELL